MIQVLESGKQQERRALEERMKGEYEGDNEYD
jgi:hypothetical protein